MFKIAKVLLGLVALFGALMLTVPTAGAEPAASSATQQGAAVSGDATSGMVVEGLGAFGTLPSCADYDHSGQDAWVINNCSYVVHAKIIWAFASDSPCTKLAANGGWMTSWRSGTARFDGAVTC